MNVKLNLRLRYSYISSQIVYKLNESLNKIVNKLKSFRRKREHSKDTIAMWKQDPKGPYK